MSAGGVVKPLRALVLVLGVGGVVGPQLDVGAAGQTPEYAQTAESRMRLASSPRHMEYVDIAAGSDDAVNAFLVYPERNRATDSVVVVHTGLAMTPWIRAVADELAEHGYVAIVPDLLSGHGLDGGNSGDFASNVAHQEGLPVRFDEADDVRRAMGTLGPDEITTRLQATIAYARALPSTTDTVSVVGFCWGGTQAFRLATTTSGLKSTFVFYGGPPSPADMATISAPVHGFYGENDFRINATIEDTKEAMAAAGKTYTPVIYEGVGHGFVQAGMGDRRILDPEGARVARRRSQQAWERLLKLLK